MNAKRSKRHLYYGGEKKEEGKYHNFLSREIIEENYISEFEVINAKEDQKRYKMKSTFDNKKSRI